ncbi:MAG TPA: PfkB family carbohydrate kinase [Schlesneria sp.]
MILAAGLTPAWQQILSFDRLTTGEVNRARESLWCGSGKVLNVGAALHHLQAESLTLCPIGGSTGTQIKDDFTRRRIAARWLSIAASTRVCTTLLDEATGTTTELVENSSPLTELELKQYLEAFAEESRAAKLVVLSGSLPKQTPPDFYRRLLERTTVPAIMDVRGQELVECLPSRPLLVKPNREELAMTVGRALDTESAVIEAMAEVRELGAQWVIVSGGPDPLLVLGPSGLERIAPPFVHVVNPIGCGDSLTAAIAAKISSGITPLEAIRFGVEYAARKAAILYPVLQPEK